MTVENIEFIIERTILKIGNELNNIRISDLKQYDMTTGQSETMLFFEAAEGARALDLKNHLSITHQAARNYVERLKAKGLLYTEVSGADARGKSVMLTEEGRDVCRKLRQKGCDTGKDILSDLNGEEKEELLRLLRRIRT